MKLKNDNNISKKVTTQLLREAKQEVFLVFNFSFLSKNNKYNFSSVQSEYKELFLERLNKLSSESIVKITSSYNKKEGLERISNFSNKDKISVLDLHPKFGEIRSKNAEGFWVFRLCPNNNPFPTRIIGKMIDNVFYIMFIDLNHELYSKKR